MKIQNILFSTNSSPKIQPLGILLMRWAISIPMMTHGLTKLLNFGQLSSVFSDPLGIGSYTSLVMIVFAEFFCSCLLIVGLFSRLATLPLIFGMGVAFFIQHGGDPFNVKELALVYFFMYIVLFILGPGTYSVDSLIRKTREG